jgi:hypothetical protein
MMPSVVLLSAVTCWLKLRLDSLYVTWHAVHAHHVDVDAAVDVRLVGLVHRELDLAGDGAGGGRGEAVYATSTSICVAAARLLVASR